MSKQKIVNIILAVIGVILLGTLIFVTISNKMDEKKRKYSDENLLEVYKSVKYDEKVNVYVFHGARCPHCKSELEFLDSKKDELKLNYNIYKFETWDNENNQKLKEKVVNQLVKDGYIVIGENDGRTLEDYINAVPLTIIGDKVFLGYLEDNIKNALDTEKENEYDVMKKLDLK